MAHLDTTTPHHLLVTGGCSALGELGRRTALSIPPLPGETQGLSKLGLLEKLVEFVSSGKAVMKVRERAALATGSLCLG